ncbi:thiol peroxidase [Myxococcota bacterium]|nr:thiol peroxidase [Myxococcota bacterium]
MAEITLKGNPIHTKGELTTKGEKVPDFTLVSTELAEVTLASYAGKKVLNIFPSVDTSVCAASVRGFNKAAGEMQGVSVLNISADLPFAHSRFCGAEGLEGVVSLSCFRSSFSEDYNLKIIDGPLAGLCSRVVLVVDEDNKVIYSEQVPEIGQEPDYDKALSALK